MSEFITQVVTRTPVWVWGLLAAMIALGLIQARDHVVSLPRVLLQPSALGALSIVSATSSFGWHAGVQLLWLAGLAVGFAVNRRLMLPRRVQALPDGRFAIGGSWAPLALILTIFVLRYVANVALAIAPPLATLPLFAAAMSAIYGLPSGLLAARAWRILQQRHRVRAQALPA